MPEPDELARRAGDAFDPPTPAPGSFHPAPPPARSLTAAAKVIDFVNEPKSLRKPEPWAATVWRLITEVPEMKFGIRFTGNSLSRCRLYTGFMVDPKEAPVDMRQALEDPELRAETGITEQFVADAESELERLSSGPDGQSGMMRGFGENLAAVGDSLLLGRAATPQDPVLDDEFWQVYSTTQIVKDKVGGGDGLRVKETPDDPGTPIPPDAIIYRIWRRDPQWSGLPDSNMRSVISEAEELLIIGRSMRATSRSRNPAGILLLPQELDPQIAARAQPGVPNPLPDGPVGPPTTDPSDQQPGTGQWTPFEMNLMRSFITPTEDDGSPASVVPHIIRGAAAFLKEVRHLAINREIDPEALARIDNLIRRMAHGTDLPVEVLTGMAEANHWTGWQIEDSTYKAHIEPTAQIPAAGLTAVHLRPALLNWGHPLPLVKRAVFGVDPSQLVVRPNRTQDAKDAYAARAISRAAYLRYLGFPDSDAPDDIELAERYVWERGIGGQDLTAQIMNMLKLVETVPGAVKDAPITLPSLIAPSEAATSEVSTDVPGAEDEDGGEEGGEPTPDTQPSGGDEPPDEAAGLALPAAAVALPDLGQTLSTIEDRLRNRLMIAASEAMARALQRAGSKLRGAVQGNPELAAEVNGQPAMDVGRILGTERAPITDPDELLAGAFDDLRGQWDAWTGQAENDARAAVTAAAGSAVDVDAPEADHDRGWAALLLGLMALARTRVFDLAADEDGEIDITSHVPAGIVRDALSVAGGGQADARPFGLAGQAGPPGMLTGPRWRTALRRVDIVAQGWTWRTGFPSHPYRPHTELGGAEFTSWDDPVLANGSSWPRTSHYYPGDHRGCQCDAIPKLVRLAAQEDQAA